MEFSLGPIQDSCSVFAGCSNTTGLRMYVSNGSKELGRQKVHLFGGI